MTRVSSSVHPSKLCDQMLIAEHREIKRVPNDVFKHIQNGKLHLLQDLPVTFRLGTGHVKFFYDKIKYLHMRWLKIDLECRKRGFKMSDWSGAFKQVPEEYQNYWRENDDPEVNRIIVERITERLTLMKEEPRYYGKVISRQKAIELLT